MFAELITNLVRRTSRDVRRVDNKLIKTGLPNSCFIPLGKLSSSSIRSLFCPLMLELFFNSSLHTIQFVEKSTRTGSSSRRASFVLQIFIWFSLYNPSIRRRIGEIFGDSRIESKSFISMEVFLIHVHLYFVFDLANYDYCFHFSFQLRRTRTHTSNFAVESRKLVDVFVFHFRYDKTLLFNVNSERHTQKLLNKAQ